LLVVDEPAPLVCVAHNIFEKTPGAPLVDRARSSLLK
jgi:hypothetical protein